MFYKEDIKMSSSKKYVPFPVMKGNFTTVYRPKGDTYRGPDTQCFKSGTYYDSWTTNDFSILNDNGTWHIVGITHPTPPDFSDENVHNAEFMLFHATAKGKTMADVLQDDIFEDQPKILYPSEREGEINECHAPHILPDGQGGFNIYYGPKYMREANTKDFRTFNRRVLFEDEDVTARDPFVFEENGTYYYIYAVSNRVDYRTSKDLVHFSEPKTLQVNPWKRADGEGASSESPYFFKRKGIYYLMWAIWDAREGSYDYRTFIFGADTIEGLKDSAPVAMLPAHAGEIYSDESGDYLLSVFYPENGINVAKIVWKNDFDE